MGDLAKYLSVSVVFISDVERGNRSPLTTERILQAAQFLGTDARPLLKAAAEERGAFELDANVSSKAREVGAVLMQGWATLKDEQLEQIAQILRNDSSSR
jgi:transcriptional regulator with XRE-family HTH domain